MEGRQLDQIIMVLRLWILIQDREKENYRKILGVYLRWMAVIAIVLVMVLVRLLNHFMMH